MPALWQRLHGPDYAPLPRNCIGYHGNAAINMLIVQNIPHICSDSITVWLQTRMKATIQCPRERRYSHASNSQPLFLRCDTISDDKSYIIYIIYYNVIWYDTMHCKTIRYQTIWYDTIWYDTIRYDEMQYQTIPNDTKWYHTIPYDTMWCVNKNSKWCKHDLLPLWTQSQKMKKRQWEHNVHTKTCTRKVSETRYKKCRKKKKVMGKKQVEAARKQQHTNQSPEQWFGIFGLSTVLLKLWAKRMRSVLDNCCLTAWDVLFWNSAVICPSKLKSYWVLFFFFFFSFRAMIREAWRIFWRLILFS